MKIIEYKTNNYGGAAPKKTSIYKRHNSFKEGRERLMYEERSVRQTTLTSSNVAVIKDLLDTDRRISLRKLKSKTDWSY